MSMRPCITAAMMTLLLVPRPATALDAKPRITQYRHTAWRVQDGALESAGCVGGDDQMRLLTANALSEDAAGALWIGAPNQLMRWHDGSFDSYLRDQLEGHALSSVISIAAARDGSVWAAIPREGFSLVRIVNGVLNKIAIHGTGTAQITSLFVDHGRSLWMGTSNNGVCRISGQRVDHFSSEHGLSGNEVGGSFSRIAKATSGWRPPRVWTVSGKRRGVVCGD